MNIYTRPGFDTYEPRTNVNLYDEVAPRIIIPTTPPYLIYGIGIARSGTTVSLNVMTSSDAVDSEGRHHPILGSYQHFKAGYRHAMHGWPNDTDEKRWAFNIPDASESPVFYVKDPLGPYTHTESIYNPLELLKLKGYPRERLFLEFFFRDPQEILASWKRNWGRVRDPEVLRANLITSCHTLRNIHGQAVREGYAHDIYLYEGIRDHPPETVVGSMFDHINAHMTPHTGMKLVMTDHTVGGWNSEEKKRIWHPDEPAIYEREEIATLHSAAKTSEELRYKRYSPKDLGALLTAQDMRELERGGVYHDYEHFRSEYVHAHGLEVHRLDDLPPIMQEGIPGSKEKR